MNNNKVTQAATELVQSSINLRAPAEMKMNRGHVTIVLQV